jgi:hypothetical protein
MLLWLAQYFQEEIGPLRVFGFITFRAVFATMTALAIGLIAGPAVIRMLARLKVGQAVRRTDLDCHRYFRAALVGLEQSVHLAGIDCDAGVWRNRLGRRLPQGGLQGSERHAFAGKIFLAIAHRDCRIAVPGFFRVRAHQHRSLGLIP